MKNTDKAALGENLRTVARVGVGGGRVAGAQVHGRLAPDTAKECTMAGSDLGICVGDLCVAMFLIESTPTAVVGELSEITGSSGRKLGNNVLLYAEQQDPSSRITIRPMKSAVEGDELLFYGESSGDEKSIPGPFIQAVTPGVRKEENKTCLFFFN